MKIWVDAQLSPQVARWLRRTFDIEADPIRHVGLHQAEDERIFLAARRALAVMMTKDLDFVMLLDRLGPPPQVIWITCGNTSNSHLQGILTTAMPEALRLIASGEALVEIAG